MMYKLSQVRPSLSFALVGVASLTPRSFWYSVWQARLNDFGRKFNEAALRYYELSWMPNLAEEERLQALFVLPPSTSSGLASLRLELSR